MADMRAVATAAVVALCGVGSWPAALAAQGPAAPVVQEVIADVSVNRFTIDAEQHVVRGLPGVRYRMAQRPGPSGPTTEITFQDTTPFPGRGPLTDPGAGFRVVIDPRSGIEVFDPRGQRLAAPGDATVPTPPAGRGVPQGALVVPPSLMARRAALVAQFGEPVGRVGDRERFVRRGEGTTEEVLADPATNLPVEINVMQDGRLTHHTVLTYARSLDGRVHLSRQREEALVPQEAGEAWREVTDTRYVLVRGGGR